MWNRKFDVYNVGTFIVIIGIIASLTVVPLAAVNIITSGREPECIQVYEIEIQANEICQHEAQAINLAVELTVLQVQYDALYERYRALADSIAVVDEPTGHWVSLGEFRITHYCTEPHHHICNDGNPTTTATGNTPIPYRTVAVCPNIIPYGSLLRIYGSDNEYIADDTGGAIRGNRTIDRLVTYHQQARDLGVFYAEVWIWRYFEYGER